ncbi:MAG: hypothetical protein WC788_04485 [Candidatus Paceibacterota bacterium]|jgi:hypothetical protein
MDLPEKLLLSKIKTRNVFLDRKSKEKTTIVVKPKYKLSSSSILDIYIFFVLTSKEITCKKYYTLTVRKEEWEEKNSCYLNGCSYIDITNIESFSKEELLIKIKDKFNGFPYVAKISDKKFSELKLLQNNINKGYNYSGISEETKDLINIALAEANIANETLKKLGLA